MNWSDEAWESISGIYASIQKMPFIEELTRGTLASAKFEFYIAQDSLYIGHFGRTLAMIAAKCADRHDALAYIKFAEEALVVEEALHRSYFQQFNLADTGEMQPACHHYVHFLRSTAAMDAVEVAMAATLPCFWIYKKVGDYIYAHQEAAENPYQQWIATYGGAEFSISVDKAIQLCNQAAQQGSPVLRQQMKAAFITASHMEYAFWEAAYNLRNW